MGLVLVKTFYLGNINKIKNTSPPPRHKYERKNISFKNLYCLYLEDCLYILQYVLGYYIMSMCVFTYLGGDWILPGTKMLCRLGQILGVASGRWEPGWQPLAATYANTPTTLARQRNSKMSAI